MDLVSYKKDIYNKICYYQKLREAYLSSKNSIEFFADFKYFSLKYVNNFELVFPKFAKNSSDAFLDYISNYKHSSKDTVSILFGKVYMLKLYISTRIYQYEVKLTDVYNLFVHLNLNGAEESW